MATPSTRSAYDAYRTRAISRPDMKAVSNTLSNAKRGSDSTLEMIHGAYELIEGHAAHIEQLRAELNDMLGFMNWAMNTYPNIMHEYKAVDDLVKSTSPESNLDKLLNEWGST